MRYFLFVQLEGFYIRQQAPARLAPFAIVRDGTILDVDAEAAQGGVRPGMELRTARAIAHELEWTQYDPELHEEAQKIWLDLCVEFTGVIEPVDQHCAFLDLSGHPNPYEISERLIRALVSATGLHVRYGAAKTKWIAKLAASLGDGGVALADPAAFLAPLPVAKLDPIAPEHRLRLQFLGYSAIGQIGSIPLEVLCRQFGPEGLRIAKATRGEILEGVKPEYPRDSLVESLIFESAVESLETLDLALKELAGRVSKRLGEKSRHGQELALHLELESGTSKSCRRRFSKPIFNYPSALSALRLLLQEGIQTEPIVAIRLRMDDLQPNREKQKGLYAMSKADEGGGLEQVRTAFGDGSVQLGSEIPIPRRVLVLREWKNATGWS